MKNVIFLFVTVFLILSSIDANAGYVAIPVPFSASAGTTAGRHASLISGPKFFGRSHREARKAFFFAMFGLLFPPLGILAIIYGARSLRSSRADQGLAVTSIIFGSVEALLTLCYVALFVIFVVII